MMDYQIQGNSRRCAVTGRELKPGEKYFSVLFDEEGRFHRKDFSHQAWQGPPSGAFSFWAGRIAAGNEDRRPPIDDEMLADCFRRLEGQTDPGRVNFRYVIALLLMRRKRLKFEETRTEAGREILTLRDTRTKARHEVVNPQLTEEAMTAVQDEVFQVLGWE